MKNAAVRFVFGRNVKLTSQGVARAVSRVEIYATDES